MNRMSWEVGIPIISFCRELDWGRVTHSLASEIRGALAAQIVAKGELEDVSAFPARSVGDGA